MHRKGPQIAICVLQIASLFAGMDSAISFDEPKTAEETKANVQPEAGGNLWRVSISLNNVQSEVEGRVLVEAQDGGVLLEERNGRIRILTATMVSSRIATEVPFTPMSPDELAADLLMQVPPGFEILQTEHYVICSNSSQEYAEFCGKLIERVHGEYFKFKTEQELPVTPLKAKLPIIILESEAEFKAFAAKQHPETSFENIPGYYSIRENQTLMMDLTRDRSIRSASVIRKRLADQPLQVATMVHEAVHQLAFNTGLQVRLADNPVWFSEGLALYFEPLSPRSSTLWTKPGIVNGRHHPEFMRCTEGGKAKLPFGELTQVDKPFLESSSVATAYAESWALSMYLFRQQKDGMKRFLTNLAQRKPLQKVTAEQRIKEFEAAFGKSPDELEPDVISYVRRLRVPK